MPPASKSGGKAGKKPVRRTAPRAGRAARCATLTIEVRESVALVALARPEVHNAFDDTLIAELTRVLEALDSDASVRAVVLLGHGRSFCAGADLNWMKRMAGFGRAENLADATALAAMRVGTELGAQLSRDEEGCDLGILRGWSLGNYGVLGQRNAGPGGGIS